MEVYTFVRLICILREFSVRCAQLVCLAVSFRSRSPSPPPSCEKGMSARAARSALAVSEGRKG